MIVKRPMIIAIMAYVLTEIMAFANCSINIFFMICMLGMAIQIVYIKYNIKKAEQKSVTAFFVDVRKNIIILIIVLLSGILGYSVMTRGMHIRRSVFALTEPTRNEGGFDEREYELSSSNILYGLNIKFDNLGYFRFLSYIKNNMEKSIEKNCDERTASIYKALLIGDKSDLNDNEKEVFKTAGIIHIFAISGMHISILGFGLYKILRKRFMMGLSAFISIFILCNYILMIGISVSVLRAVVMFLLRIGAEVAGRKYDKLNGMIIGMIIVSSIYPWGFISFSFQMSFAAVFICYFFIPQIEHFLKVNNGLLSVFISAISINVLLIPLVANCYYEVYPYSILLNVLILPFMGVVLIFGFLRLYSVGSFIILGGYNLCEKVCALEKSRVICGNMEWWQILCCIILILIFYFTMIYCKYLENIIKRKTKDYDDYVDRINVRIIKYVFSIFFFISILIIVVDGKKVREDIFKVLNINGKEQINIYMLDVGQGDFIYVKTSDGLNITMDGGSSDVKNVSKNVMLPFLKYKAIREIDYAFVSHSDDDHTNGLMDIIANNGKCGIRVKNIVVPRLGKKDEKLEDIIRIAKECKVNIIYLNQGDRIGKFTCLMPYENIMYDDVNDTSMVLSYVDKVKNNEKLSMLFTGDYSFDDNVLINSIKKYTNVSSYTILKVAHHGSKYSTGVELIKQINPVYAFISCGRKNRYGHPSQELLERIRKYSKAKVYVTKTEGEIRYTCK